MIHWILFFVLVCVRLAFSGLVAPPIVGNLEWWQTSTIYEIYPLSFKDSNNDGYGDFRGIIQKLDYLVDLEVNAIWITPFLESPLKSGGYDISNFTNVQSVFGTLDDFKELIASAHKKHIEVLMDFVPNHTSDEHEWFKKSIKREGKYTDYYIWKDATNQAAVLQNASITPIPPNNWKRICPDGDDNSGWIWHNTRKQFYFTQFIPNLPDLNFRKNEVHQEMKNILKYWLNLGVDGIRIDALKHVYESESMENEPVIDPYKTVDYNNLNHIYTTNQVEVYDLIKEWHDILGNFSVSKKRIIMTESYSQNDVLFKYYTSGAEIPTNFNLMSYDTPKDYNREIYNWISEMPKGATYNVVFQNHDSKRISTKYGPELVDGYNALSLFLPGVSIVYYGGEIGMEDIKDPINFSRSLMQWDNTKNSGFSANNTPWLPQQPDYQIRNVLAESNEPKSYLNFFKSVSKLRQTETLKRGGLETYVFNDAVFVVRRFLPENENFTLLINMNSTSQHVCLMDQIPKVGKSLTVLLGSFNSIYNSGNTISTESLVLGPYTTLVVTDKLITSSGTQWYSTSKVLIFCLIVIKMCC